MGSRRQFTQEFKLAAVRRLEQGVSIAEVARGLEVNPNVLQRWRREFRQGPGNAFPGTPPRQACALPNLTESPIIGTERPPTRNISAALCFPQD
jgi:transposase-like protein